MSNINGLRAVFQPLSARWGLPSKRQYDAALAALVMHPEVLRVMRRPGYTPRSLAYDVQLALRWVDERLTGAERQQIAADLIPLRRKVLRIKDPEPPKVPPGCCVTPIPDLRAWGGASGFWQRLVRNAETECWEYPGMPGKHGRVKIYGKAYSPHRVAYTLKHGPIPVGSGYHGTVVRHTCDNPVCCNPDHLVLGRQRDNVRDMVERGRGGFPINATN